MGRNAPPLKNFPPGRLSRWLVLFSAICPRIVSPSTRTMGESMDLTGMTFRFLQKWIRPTDDINVKIAKVKIDLRKKKNGHDLQMFRSVCIRSLETMLHFHNYFPGSNFQCPLEKQEREPKIVSLHKSPARDFSKQRFVSTLKGPITQKFIRLSRVNLRHEDSTLRYLWLRGRESALERGRVKQKGVSNPWSGVIHGLPVHLLTGRRAVSLGARAF